MPVKNAGAPVVRAPVNMFRFVVQETNIHAITVGEIKTTNAIIETPEGGSQTIVDQTIASFKVEPVAISRALTSDRLIEEWDANLRSGQDDKRDCYFVQLDARGNDLYRWPLYQCVIADYSRVKGDAKATEEQQMETFTLKAQDIGEREDLQ